MVIISQFYKKCIQSINKEGINMVYDGKKCMTKNFVYDKIIEQVEDVYNEAYTSKRCYRNG